MAVRGWVAGMLGLVLLVGCAGGSPPPAAVPSDPLPRPVASPSPSPSPTDPFARPAVVDAAWVERVYDALAAVESRALAVMIEAHENAMPFPQQAVTLFRSVYGPNMFATQVGSWMKDFADPHGLDGLRRPVGRTDLRVEEILAVTDDCVLVRGVMDYTETAVSPRPGGLAVVVGLRPLPADRDPEGHNPTGWMLDDGSTLDTYEPAEGDDPCAF